MKDDESATSSTTGENSGDLSGEAAGVVRGVSRSIVRAPLIGRLPKASMRVPAPKPPPSSAVGRSILRRRVPVRRVARVSDRVSTGWDWYTSAVEADEVTNTGNSKTTTTTSKTSTTTSQWLIRAQSFTWSLLKNTLLGMAVFEGFGYVVGSLAPPAPAPSDPPLPLFSTDRDENEQNHTSVPPVERGWHHLVGLEDDDENDDEESSAFSIREPDEYSRASLPAHFWAGAAAGTIHGMASTVMEGNPTNHHSLGRYAFLNTVHHAMAHAMLFGSYETIKRGILKWTEDEERSFHGAGRAYHLITFGLAGGIAGQMQHLVSHYVEEAFGLTNQTLQLDWRSSLRSTPSLRPVLRAFPPSAIGFIAFEYGKEFSASS